MRKTFWVPIALALAAYVLLPLPGQSRAAVEADRGEALAGGGEEAQGGRAHDDDPGLQQPDRRAAGRDPPAAEAPRRVVQSELDAQASELLRVRDRPGGGARPPRARRARSCGPRARALADRLVELYKADEPDALTVVLEADGFARPARADRVPRADLDAGLPRSSSEVRVLKARARAGRTTAGASSSAAKQLAAERSSAAATTSRRPGIGSPRRRASCAPSETAGGRCSPRCAASGTTRAGGPRGARGASRPRCATRSAGRRARRPSPRRRSDPPRHPAG